MLAVISTSAFLMFGTYRQSPQIQMMVGIIFLGVCIKIAMSQLQYGSYGFQSWISFANSAGIFLGLLSALIIQQFSKKIQWRIALWGLIILVILSNLLPPNPYHLSQLQLLPQGRLTHFNGLLEWLSHGLAFISHWCSSARFAILFCNIKQCSKSKLWNSYNCNMSQFQYHAFFCLNSRKNGENSCEHHGATALFDYAKNTCKNLNLNGKGKVRVNRAGCLDRCDFGPVMVVYPEGIWYQLVDEQDVDEIIQSHFIQGVPVKRLMLEDQLMISRGLDLLIPISVGVAQAKIEFPENTFSSK
jgi:(2Fe-2S) ferredoxin